MPSSGRITSSSTSSADAPGSANQTWAPGTTIWGFSSRGVMITAIAPSSAQASMNSTVSLDVTNRLASRPALLSLGSLIGRPWRR